MAILIILLCGLTLVRTVWLLTVVLGLLLLFIFKLYLLLSFFERYRINHIHVHWFFFEDFHAVCSSFRVTDQSDDGLVLLREFIQVEIFYRLEYRQLL